MSGRDAVRPFGGVSRADDIREIGVIALFKTSTAIDRHNRSPETARSRFVGRPATPPKAKDRPHHIRDHDKKSSNEGKLQRHIGIASGE